jgi:hypothetical protein
MLVAFGMAWLLRLDDIPVFARPGAIVPLAAGSAVDGIGNPAELEVSIFPGANRRFELFEDDGESSAYQQGTYRITPFTQEWGDNRLHFEIEPVQGFAAAGPQERTFTLLFKGIVLPEQVEVELDGQSFEIDSRYDSKTSTLRLSGIRLAAGSRLTGGTGNRLRNTDRSPFAHAAAGAQDAVGGENADLCQAAH